MADVISIDTPLDRIKRSIQDEWVQGKYGDIDYPTGPVCLVGAFMREKLVNKTPRVIIDRIEEVAQEMVESHGYADVTDFNDDQDTTQDQVLAFIEAMRAEFKRRSMEVFNV